MQKYEHHITFNTNSDTLNYVILLRVAFIAFCVDCLGS